MEKLGVIIVAGGKGSRMKSNESKQFLYIGDKPILIHTLHLFEDIPEVQEIVLVVGETDFDKTKLLIANYVSSKLKIITIGGIERQDSVRNGLLALSEDTKWVLVHDAVRPFVTKNQVLSCWYKAIETEAAVLAVPVKETIKVVDEHGVIVSTPDRKRLWVIQTPQAFRLDLLKEAHIRALDDQFLGTDDAMLVERMGKQVHVVEGDYYNIKITTPDDRVWAEWILTEARGEVER